MDRRDRILLVGPRYLGVSGGVERHVEALAERLACSGFEVHVAATDPSGKLPARETRAGVEIHRFPTVLHDATFHVSPGLMRWLIRTASRFDLVHTHSYHSPVMIQAAVASLIHRRPFIITTHAHADGHSPIRRLLHVPYRVIAAGVLRAADRVVCVSEVERRRVLDRFGPAVRTVVIPNGTDRPRSSVAPFDERPRRVLAVARLERYKQVDRIVRALASLPTDVTLRVIGAGPEEGRLRTLANELGISERVEITRYVAREELEDAYRSARVVVSMSREEAFGLTLLEAAAGGASLVVSDIPAHQEVLGLLGAGEGALVDVDARPEDLADAIHAALEVRNTTNPDSLPTWDDMTERVVALYREVLSSPRGALAVRRARAARRA